MDGQIDGSDGMGGKMDGWMEESVKKRGRKRVKVWGKEEGKQSK